MLNAAISAGGLSAGSAFDKTTLLALEQQAQDFASLFTGNAGSRVTDESFNYPLSLLLARAKALAAEVWSFTAVSERLLDVLANETGLVDELIAADSLAQWISTLPQIRDVWSTGWDQVPSFPFPLSATFSNCSRSAASRRPYPSQEQHMWTLLAGRRNAWTPARALRTLPGCLSAQPRRTAPP